jgi:serine phosphatase RsbU (regulator of sigma subunit)
MVHIRQPRSLPEIGHARFAIRQQPRTKTGGGFFDVRRLDEHHLGFLLGDVMSSGASGALLGSFLLQAATMKTINGNWYRLVPPEEVLADVNRALIGLNLEEPPLVAMVVGKLNVEDGTLNVARAGLPAPIYLPADGEVKNWSIPGPYLGGADAINPSFRTTLRNGDKLLFAGAGVSDPDRLLAAATRHRALSGQSLLDAIDEESTTLLLELRAK